MSDHNHSWDTDQLLQITQQWEVPVSISREEAWNSFVRKTEQRSSSKVISFLSPRRYVYLVAASLTLLAAAYFLFFKVGTEVVTSASGERLTYILPDKSAVIMNAGSSLEYQRTNFSDHRTIFLKGEAFFDVKEGNTFAVVTDFGEVRVLGTSFNIFSRQSRLDIACISGKVEVVIKEPDFTTKLEKGQRIVLRGGKLTADENIDLKKALAWQSGEYYFDRAPLKDVTEELERQFKITILSDHDFSGRYYSGYFTNKDLPEALKMVFLPMGLDYEQRGDMVEIR